MKKLLLLLLMVGGSSLNTARAGAHTIPELLNAPESFHQREVTVTGEVVDVVTRYGEKPYTTFIVRNEENAALPVFVWGTPTFKQGQVCQIDGTFVTEKVLSSYALKKGIEATTVGKTPETETRIASTIFKKKKRTGIRGARGFYMPQ
ncbi:MAG: hypothetical protein FJ147_11165 [Deltaproteobacteria bacterium]|nr:hypothetical protein [Deltaproteobacteria bacterium]